MTITFHVSCVMTREEGKIYDTVPPLICKQFSNVLAEPFLPHLCAARKFTTNVTCVMFLFCCCCLCCCLRPQNFNLFK
jgi:hypothetical protein